MLWMMAMMSLPLIQVERMFRFSPFVTLLINLSFCKNSAIWNFIKLLYIYLLLQPYIVEYVEIRA